MSEEIILFLENLCKNKIFKTSHLISLLIRDFNSLIIDDRSNKDIRTVNLLVNNQNLEITCSIILEKNNNKKQEYIIIKYLNYKYEFIVNY